MQPGEVFSGAQDHVIAAARAHVERLVLEAFVDKVRDDAGRRPQVALDLLCDLHALSTIEADRAWFMEHGRLSVRPIQGDHPRGQRPVPEGPADSPSTWSTPSAYPPSSSAPRTSSDCVRRVAA